MKKLSVFLAVLLALMSVLGSFSAAEPAGRETPITYVEAEGDQAALGATLKEIIEVDGLKFKDLNGNTSQQFLEKISVNFTIENQGNAATNPEDSVIVSDTFDPALTGITVTLLPSRRLPSLLLPSFLGQQPASFHTCPTFSPPSYITKASETFSLRLNT